jgi:cytochrome c oxidase subunit 3
VARRPEGRAEQRMAQAAVAHADGVAHGGHGVDHIHAENPNLAHHFDTPQQQFEAGKLGIWLFLVTEVLFFAGLFCAYTIYRSQNPEVFEYAHYYLDTNMGALNTVVLLVSSFTAAYAVRCAQQADKRKLTISIVITILCACTFMVVKYFEYAHKFHDGLLPGKHFAPTEQAYELPRFREKYPEAAELAEKIKTGKLDPAERVSKEALEPLVKAGMVDEAKGLKEITIPKKTHVFFSIYFFMTGLHGVHVLVGIGIWIWMLFKAQKNVFNKNYFGPVDYSALYWHLVDLVWIYLFPLLYLIS